jgi:hypothetical protein
LIRTYKVFNPLDGTYATYPTEEEAKDAFIDEAIRVYLTNTHDTMYSVVDTDENGNEAWYAQTDTLSSIEPALIQNNRGAIVARAPNKPPVPVGPLNMPEEISIMLATAKAAFASAGKPQEGLMYRYTVYSVALGIDIAHVFSSGYNMIKVDIATGVAESTYYSFEPNAEHTSHMWLSRSLSDDSIVDIYTSVPQGVIKNAGTDDVLTVMTDYTGMPPQIKAQIGAFSYTDQIFAWSIKPTGLILEYYKYGAEQ